MTSSGTSAIAKAEQPARDPAPAKRLVDHDVFDVEAKPGKVTVRDEQRDADNRAFATSPVDTRSATR